MRKIVVVVLFGWCTTLFAADPGGLPGLVKAKFTGSVFDSTSEVGANAIGRVLYPEEMYATSLPEKTTVAWAGYMKMAGGVTYNFKGCYDDFVTVKIGSIWVLSKGNGCKERTGSYTPVSTDWYAVEFRVGNDGGEGGLRNSSQYGILWNTSEDSTWRKVQAYAGWTLFKTGRTGLTMDFSKTTPIVISSNMRKADPTVMDVEYIVLSKSDTVNVRALAFEDGERSFWKVVRATTFTKDVDGNETACNIGDGIAANVPHKLAWKVSADWKTDLAKVKFEVICSDAAQLPLKLQTIPATAKNPAMTIGYNSQSDADIFNALLWYYAKGDEHLVNVDGYVDVKGVDLIAGQTRWVNRTSIAGEHIDILKWLYAQMGYEPLVGGNLMDYVRKATRKDLWWNTGTRNCVIKSSTKPKNLYLGEKAYCVIDVSGGPEATNYPVTYLDTEPVNGWGDEYKTTKILLRRCEPGKYNMQNNKPVTLTKPFYMGVFTITQKQYLQVMGSNPTPSNHIGDLRPVEISWNAIRGDSATYKWPMVRTVDPNTFVGKIQAKTGLNFDLPTEAQWEYACRAGTSSNFGNGGGRDNDLRLMGHSGSDNAVNVGLYIPNFWGFYDMHGNVGQWCLDYSDGYNSDPAIDYEGAESGSARVIRGYNYYFTTSSSFYRFGDAPSSYHYYYGNNAYRGFRLSRTIEE